VEKIRKSFEERKKRDSKKKRKNVFSVSNKSFEEEKKNVPKNANCVIKACARVLQRTKKRMSYRGEGFAVDCCRLFLPLQTSPGGQFSLIIS
jgi:16S rRNA A1518/A1519 N6-dimethyltransferase RsmA/KsgA/DIM1 with predicted DNA glycosylase/AP lyase activity